MLWTEARDLPGVAARMHARMHTHTPHRFSASRANGLICNPDQAKPLLRGLQKGLAEYVQFKANTQDPALIWSLTSLLLLPVKALRRQHPPGTHSRAPGPAPLPKLSPSLSGTEGEKEEGS